MILKTKLLSHQQKALDKLSGLRVGALFMEMGTGKTRTIFEIMSQKQDKWDRVYYFCPCSIRQSIAKEIEKHLEGIEYRIIKSSKIILAEFMIIGIESLSNSDRLFLTLNEMVTENSFIVVDESILIKNHRAKRTRRLTQIAREAKYRFVMCGTPMSQGMVDLYSQFFFLSPKIIGYDYFKQFERRHIEYSDKYPGKINLYFNEGFIAAKINPYIYQVTKKECLDLPEKIFYTEYFSMSSNMKYAYNHVKNEILMDIDYEEFYSYTIFKLFTALQQVISAINPKGFDFEFETNSRLSLLEEILERILYPVVIFCKFSDDINQIKTKIKDCSLFYGGMKQDERDKSINDFQSGETKIFLATQQSGAYGLNLQMARTVLFYNNQFSYEKRRQAIDRVHRIGMNPEGVNYIDLHCSDSIDDLISNCLECKTNVIKAFKDEIDKIKDKKEKEKRIKELI